jgi:hypothetical protein
MRMLSVLCALALAAAAFAWNGATHAVTAEIAYVTLQQQQPAVLQKALALLKAHPDYAKWQADLEGVPAGEESHALFMRAARWPDDIRRKGTYREYDHPEWHYVDLQFVLDGRVPRPQETPDNIIRGFNAEMAVLSSRQPDARKAVALCWVLHLAGDAHCPLHAITLYANQFPPPDGDRGGTRFYVRPAADRKAKSLHSLWDGAVIGSTRYKSDRDCATVLRHSLTRAEIARVKELRIEQIVKESYAIARDTAYRKGALPGAAEETDDAPILPAGYLQTMQTTAERRVALAGTRLAGMVGKALK